MANRFWVGASGQFNDGSKWSTSSGGTGGAGAPTLSDDAFFDANSGGGTITVSGDSRCASLNMTGFTGSVTGVNNTILINGNVTIPTTVTWSRAVGFMQYMTGSTYDTNNRTLGELRGISTQTGTLLSALNVTTVLFISLTTNNNSITCTGDFSGGNGSLGTSTITCANGSSAFGTGGASATFICSGNFGAQSGSTTGTVTTNGIQSGGVGTTATIINLTVTGSSIGLGDSSSLTVNGSFTFNGSATSRKRVNTGGNFSTVYGSSTLNLTGTRSVSYADFGGVNVTGGTLTGTSLGNLGGSSGIAFASPRTLYAVGGASVWPGWTSTSSWSTTSGGAAGAEPPMVEDTAIFNSNSGGGVFNVYYEYAGNMTVESNFAGSMGGSVSFYSSVTINGGNTAGLGVLATGNKVGSKSFSLNGTIATFDSNGAGTCFISSPGTFVVSGGVRVNAGMVVDFQSVSPTLGFFAMSVGSYGGGVVMGSGTWTVTGDGQVWFVQSGGLNQGTSTIVLSNTSPNTRTFAGGGRSYNKLVIGGLTGSMQTTIQGSNTFSELSSTKTTAHTVLFESGTTQTIGKWTISGSSGSVVTVGSTSTANHNLVYNGTGVVSANYLSISKSTATPSTATWYAGANSIDGGNNSGWIFGGGSNGLLFGSNF